MKRLLLDVDGVIADFHKHTLDFLAREKGLHYGPESWTEWDLLDIVGREHEDYIEAMWARQGWCEAIPAYDGAVESVRALMDVADVFFVTAQMSHTPFWMWERQVWLQERFGPEAKRRLVFAMTKHVVVGDILVDDRPKNIDQWHQAHPDKVAVVWDQPWNRYWKEPEGVLRTRDWGALMRLVSA